MYVEMKHIYKTFGGFCASDDVNFGVEKGHLAALLGPSGSGKTTILRMLAGLDIPDSGDIFIDGVRVNDVPAAKRGVGFVFQNYALFRYMTVFDNIAFGLEIQKRPKEEIRSRVEELLALTGMEGLGSRYPGQLSGGQKQRVAFARALAPYPHLLLLDEPFAAIDAKLRKELRSWLRDMIMQVKITSIFVTHDQEEAIEVADRIIITNKGRVEQVGTPEDVYENPQTPFAARFLGQSQEIPDPTKLAGYETAKSPALIRPEDVSVWKENETAPTLFQQGIVRRVAFRGDSTELSVELPGTGIHLWVNRTPDKEPVAVGESVAVFVRQLYALNGDTVTRLQPKYIK